MGGLASPDMCRAIIPRAVHFGVADVSEIITQRSATQRSKTLRQLQCPDFHPPNDHIVTGSIARSSYPDTQIFIVEPVDDLAGVQFQLGDHEVEVWKQYVGLLIPKIIPSNNDP